MDKINKLNWAAIGVIVAVFIGIPGWLTYINLSKPQLVVQGDISTWFIPEPVSSKAPMKTQYLGRVEPTVSLGYFEDSRTYITFTITNTGSAVAKDVRINLPYTGLYSSDYGETLSEFTDQIELGELRPKDPQYIWIWTNENQVSRIKNVYVNYENGSADVDFGIKVYGIWENILLILIKAWILAIVIIIFILVLLLANILEKSKNKNVLEEGQSS